MKDGIANDEWNFADIKLPKPYEMRRYIENQRQKRDAALGLAANGAMGASAPRAVASVGATTTHTTTIQVNGADTAKVRQIIQEVVGGSTKVRTTQARRR